MYAIYFIEKDGIKYYKCDTFWSKSKNQNFAKIHDDSIYDQERFLKSLLYSLDRLDNLENPEEVIEFYENSIYGYQTINITDNKTTEILNTIYLKCIVNVSKEGYDIIDYKQILIDEKIDKIMKK